MGNINRDDRDNVTHYLRRHHHKEFKEMMIKVDDIIVNKNNITKKSVYRATFSLFLSHSAK